MRHPTPPCRTTLALLQPLYAVLGDAGYGDETSLIWLGDAGVSVTICQDKAGADQSSKLAAEWVRANVTTQTSAPMVSEGEVILQL